MSYDGNIDCSPIVVDISLFHTRWKEMFHMPVTKVYMERAEELKNKYSCFRSKSNFYNKNSMKTNVKIRDDNNDNCEFPAMRHMRPRIGLLFTNTEGKAKKNFTSFMNKLSPQNKGGILHNFVKSLVAENMHIYIEQIILLFQMQPTYHELYMEVLYEIIKLSPQNAKGLLEMNFQQFINEEKYKIPDSIIDNLDMLDTSHDQLDQLCEYVKWKKHIKAIMTFYIHCISNGVHSTVKDIENIMICICEMIEKNWHMHAIVDIYLDIALHCIQTIRNYCPKGMSTFQQVSDRCLQWNSTKDTLKASCRFKILDITDIIKKTAKK